MEFWEIKNFFPQTFLEIPKCFTRKYLYIYLYKNIYIYINICIYIQMMLLKCCTQHGSKFGKLGRAHRTVKGQVFIPIPKKDNAKEWSHYCTIGLISHASNIKLKILQARLQQYMNQELVQQYMIQKYKLDVEKAEGPEITSLTSVGSSKKQKNSRKTSISASLTMLKSLCIIINCGKSLKRYEYQTTLPAS